MTLPQPSADLKRASAPTAWLLGPGRTRTGRVLALVVAAAVLSITTSLMYFLHTERASPELVEPEHPSPAQPDSDPNTLDPANWVSLGNVARQYGDAYSHPNRGNATLETERLERLLFPWLAGAAPQLASTAAAAASASGRGIVITTGSKYALIARHSITTLRERGSVLPIEIVYCGDSDLGEPQRAMLAALPGVTAVDMKKLLPGLECAADWSSKPFAVLVSSFREVILMDADALFFQKPEVLFDMQGYRETGALFFRDRSLPYGLWGFGVGTSELLGQIAAPYLDRLLINSTQVAKWQVSHVFDSGVVVWDKQRAMPAILLTCLLNSEPFKETLYKKTLGDKESFWMAHEALRVPFKMAPGNGGAIGTGHQVGDVFRVCGVLFHPDEHGRPLWFNGGLFPRGSTEVQPVVAPEFVAIEYESRRAVWEYLGSQFCLRTRLGTAAEAVASGDAISYKLEGSDKAAAQRMVQLWTEISGDASVGGL